MEMSEKKPLLTRRVLYLSTDVLRPNPHQPRRDFDENSLRELSESPPLRHLAAADRAQYGGGL